MANGKCRPLTLIASFLATTLPTIKPKPQLNQHPTTPASVAITIALRGEVTLLVIASRKRSTNGVLASTYPEIRMIAICMANDRSDQKPSPHSVTAFATETPSATTARPVVRSVSAIAITKASGIYLCTRLVKKVTNALISAPVFFVLSAPKGHLSQRTTHAHLRCLSTALEFAFFERSLKALKIQNFLT